MQRIIAALSLGIAAATISIAAPATDLIGASLLTQNHPFYLELAAAMKTQAKAKKANLQVAIANQDLGKQLADVEDFIVKGARVIVISPVDSKGVFPAIKKAEDAGIEVITVDIPAQGITVASHIGTDNYAGGVEAGKLMAEVLNEKGKVAIIDYPTVQSVVARVEGFKKALSSYPNLDIVAEQAGITRAAARATAENILQAHPDVKGIFGFGDDAALAAAAAVRSAGLQQQVKVIAFDGMKEARDAVDNDPVMAGVILQYPEKMGKKAIDTSLALLEGKNVPKRQPIVPGVYRGK